MSVVPASLRARIRASIETPVARFFGRLGFTPNALTLIGFGIAIVGAGFAATQAWLIAGLVVGFGAIFDLFDGALARATGKTSRFGAFLDSTFDRLGEAAVYIGIALGYLWVFEEAVMVAMFAMAAAFMVSYVRARAEGLGFSPGTGMASVGFAPREVRTALLVLGLLLAPVYEAVYGETGLGPDGLLAVTPAIALGLIFVLSTITTIQRILFTYNQSRSQHQEVDH